MAIRVILIFISLTIWLFANAQKCVLPEIDLSNQTLLKEVFYDAIKDSKKYNMTPSGMFIIYLKEKKNGLEIQIRKQYEDYIHWKDDFKGYAEIADETFIIRSDSSAIRRLILKENDKEFNFYTDDYLFIDDSGYWIYLIQYGIIRKVEFKERF